MGRWSKNERKLLSITLLLLFLLGIKSFFFDGYKPENPLEEVIMERVLEDLSFKAATTGKVVKIKKLDANHFENLNLDQGYLIVVRKYLLGIIPYGEMRILE